MALHEDEELTQPTTSTLSAPIDTLARESLALRAARASAATWTARVAVELALGLAAGGTEVAAIGVWAGRTRAGVGLAIGFRPI